ncbi:Bifunctional purine biosynthetic protein ade1 [Saitoella coloradoensis]
MSAVQTTDFPNLPLLARGKVRDLYSLPSNPDALLFVATDRISAYDVILSNPVPQKGQILTGLSKFWFKLLGDVCPNHLLATEVEDMPQECQEYKDVLKGRSMLVKKMEVLPIEAIVRGYLSGSGWKEYKKSGTCHGIKLPEGLQESEKLPQPLFTPSTKAEQGEHDENIHPSKVAEIIGAEKAAEVERLALELYTRAAEYARSRGIIIADTKFEFGYSAPENKIYLIDEVLTPDSSRFWRADAYEVGRGQDSYDKQFLRDWLTREGVAGKDGVGMTEEIQTGTRAKYVEAYEVLTGEKWVAV